MKKRIKKIVALFAATILLCSNQVLAAEPVSSDLVSISEDNIEEAEAETSETPETPDSETEDEQNADSGETETELTENIAEDPVETDDESEEEDTAEGENTEDLGGVENNGTDNINEANDANGTEGGYTDEMYELDETSDDVNTDGANPEEPPELAPPIKHDHEWGETWSYDEKFHWHECNAVDCPITEDSEKDGYVPHVFGEWVTTEYDGSEDTSRSRDCTICGYRQITGLRPPGCGDGCVYVPDIEEAFLVEIIDEPDPEDSSNHEVATDDQTIMVADEYVPLQVFCPTGDIRPTTTSDNAVAIPTIVKKSRSASFSQTVALTAEKREISSLDTGDVSKSSHNLSHGDASGRSGDSEVRQVALVDNLQSPSQIQPESQPMKAPGDTFAKFIIAIMVASCVAGCGFVVKQSWSERKNSSRK